MRWNLPLLMLLVLAGPLGYGLMALVQPSGLTVFLALAALPALMLLAAIIRFLWSLGW